MTGLIDEDVDGSYLGEAAHKKHNVQKSDGFEGFRKFICAETYQNKNPVYEKPKYRINFSLTVILGIWFGIVCHHTKNHHSHNKADLDNYKKHIC